MILNYFVTLLMTRTRIGEKLEDGERKVVESDPSNRVTQGRLLFPLMSAVSISVLVLIITILW